MTLKSPASLPMLPLELLTRLKMHTSTLADHVALVLTCRGLYAFYTDGEAAEDF